MNWGYLNDHSGSDENFWDDWKGFHNGSHQSLRSRWFIDDQDTEGYETKQINRGGMYNVKDIVSNASQNPIPGASLEDGFGIVDLSYACFDNNTPTSEGAKFNDPWGRLSVPGTTFRFKQDPAQIVYRIEAVQGRLGTAVGSGGSIGGGTRMFLNSHKKNSGWKKDGSGPFMGGGGDRDWNYGDDGEISNKRWGVRIKVDKQWGGGSNHIWKDGMAPMSKPDPTAPGGVRMLVDGDRYDGAIVSGSFTDPIAGGTVTYPVGHNHNCF
jgi:hypothetical protein